MSADGEDQLVEKSWKDPLVPTDVRRLGELLAQSRNEVEQIGLLGAAGRGHAIALRPQVERFLSAEHDPMVFAAALDTLTGWWSLELEYRDVILAALQGYAWDTDQDVRIAGLIAAVDLIEKQADREVLEAVIAVTELSMLDPDDEGSGFVSSAKDKALVTLRKLLTPSWRDLPALERIRVPEGAEAAGILARAKQMLAEQMDN